MKTKGRKPVMVMNHLKSQLRYLQVLMADIDRMCLVQNILNRVRYSKLFTYKLGARELLILKYTAFYQKQYCMWNK